MVKFPNVSVNKNLTEGTKQVLILNHHLRPVPQDLHTTPDEMLNPVVATCARAIISRFSGDLWCGESNVAQVKGNIYNFIPRNKNAKILIK